MNDFEATKLALENSGQIIANCRFANDDPSQNDIWEEHLRISQDGYNAFRRIEKPRFSRTWAMPNHETFSVKPIGDFIGRYLAKSKVSIDPFARNKRLATYTNDLDPNTKAEFHMDAEEFCKQLGKTVDLVLFDPPYSPRQISECYKSIGMEVGMKETQSALLYKRVRDAAHSLVIAGGIVLSFGWNTVGMGKERGYEIEEIMLCCHGGAHNDTICLAERKMETLL
jgi:hypothetical protein